MSNSKAIVTLAIGKKYLTQWRQLCQLNWQKYADKHGYDLICIDTPLDSSERAQRRSPAWQKCLILSQDFSREYERIVWIDSDILINFIDAPCIVENVPVEKIGATNAYSSPTKALYSQILKRQYQYYEYCGDNPIINNTARDYYSIYGLPPQFDDVVHTGVLVLSPNHHRQILEKAYFDYEEKGDASWNYEMRPLSWEVLNADSIHWIDHRFNLIWLDYVCLNYPFLLEKSSNKVTRKLRRVMSKLPLLPHSKLRKICASTAYLNSFFLHFAGSAYDMSLVNTSLASWYDLSI
jgi:hypothetical protein